jgi:hypothetical protein
MRSDESDIADHELVQPATGSWRPDAARKWAGHLTACWLCWARKQEFEKATWIWRRLRAKSPRRRFTALTSLGPGAATIPTCRR